MKSACLVKKKKKKKVEGVLDSQLQNRQDCLQWMLNTLLTYTLLWKKNKKQASINFAE